MSRQPGVTAGRVGRRWRAVQARVFAEETVCWLCGWSVDMDLPPRHPQAKSVDHVVPLSLGGSPEDRANCRLAHYGCNSRRGNRTDVRRVRTSRPW